MMSVIAALLVLAGGVGTVAGVVSLFSPQIARVPSRWFALPLLFSLLGLGGLGMILSPDGTGQSANETRGSGAILFAFWLALLWLGRVMARRVRLREERLTTDLPRKPGILAKLAADYKAELAKAEAERAEKQARKEAARKEKAKTAEREQQMAQAQAFARKAAAAPTPEPAPEPTKASSSPALVIDLEEEFQRLKSGEIDLDEYQIAIEEEQVLIREDAKLLREDRRYMDPDEYELAKEALEERREGVRWRLDWVKKKKRDEQLYQENPHITGRGKRARFEYVDHYGEITEREIVNWEVSGRYVRGFCLLRKEGRNFRIDRISDWVEA